MYQPRGTGGITGRHPHLYFQQDPAASVYYTPECITQCITRSSCPSQLVSTVAPSFTSSLFIEHCILLCIAPAGVPTETTINSHLPQTPLKSEPASFLLKIRASLQINIWTNFTSLNPLHFFRGKVKIARDKSARSTSLCSWCFLFSNVLMTYFEALKCPLVGFLWLLVRHQINSIENKML